MFINFVIQQNGENRNQMREESLRGHRVTRQTLVTKGDEGWGPHPFGRPADSLLAERCLSKSTYQRNLFFSISLIFVGFLSQIAKQQVSCYLGKHRKGAWWGWLEFQTGGHALLTGRAERHVPLANHIPSRSCGLDIHGIDVSF